MPRIKILGLASGAPSDYDGHYVVHYDPAYVHPEHGYDGGALTTSPSPERAKVFPTAAEAMDYWGQQAPSPWHIRPDGRPNKPLTAFTVEVS